uniref:Dickkopf-related protein 3-like n=1 Tax=Saccoglossus kowalevskii TaxID=10224 RepID=A0ABM0MAT5_SACKO|nr:PREDICTED: dickkopf-related protein 3-like [Saccoglossus kowalevskii]
MACGYIVPILMLMVVGAADAYIWSWMWSSPYQPQSDEHPDMKNHPRNIHRVLNPDFNGTIDYEPCMNDKTCGRGRYCDKHYGNCRSHKLESQPCRRDGHCQKGFDCMFGKCVKALKSRSLGARCKNDRDCEDNMCCAKQHGESICKAKLKVGSKCYVPEGGMEYTINTICPCEDTLVCRRAPIENTE